MYMRRDNDVAVEFYGRAIPLQNVLTGFCCQQPLLKILLIGFYLLSVTTSDEYITKCQVQILAGLIFLLSASTRGVNYLQSSTKAFKQFVTCFHIQQFKYPKPGVCLLRKQSVQMGGLNFLFFLQSH